MNEVPSPDELEKYQRTIDTLLHQTNTSDVMRRLFSLTIQLLERHFVIAPYNREEHASDFLRTVRFCRVAKSLPESLLQKDISLEITIDMVSENCWLWIATRPSDGKNSMSIGPINIERIIPRIDKWLEELLGS